MGAKRVFISVRCSIESFVVRSDSCAEHEGNPSLRVAHSMTARSNRSSVTSITSTCFNIFSREPGESIIKPRRSADAIPAASQLESKPNEVLRSKRKKIALITLMLLNAHSKLLIYSKISHALSSVTMCSMRAPKHRLNRPERLSSAEAKRSGSTFSLSRPSKPMQYRNCNT